MAPTPINQTVLKFVMTALLLELNYATIMKQILMDGDAGLTAEVNLLDGNAQM